MPFLESWKDESRRDIKDLFTQLRVERRLPRRSVADRVDDHSPELLALVKQMAAMQDELKALRGQLAAAELKTVPALAPAPSFLAIPPAPGGPASSDLAALRSEIAALREAASRREREVLEDDLKALRGEFGALKDKVSTPTPPPPAEPASHDLAALRSEVAALREAAARREKEALEDDLKALRGEFSALKEKVSAPPVIVPVPAPGHALEGELQTLRGELSALRETAARREKDELKDELKAELEAVRGDLGVLKEKAAAPDHPLASELKALREEILSMRQASAQRDRDELTGEVRALREEIMVRRAEPAPAAAPIPAPANPEWAAPLDVLRGELQALREARRQDQRDAQALELGSLRAELDLLRQARRRDEQEEERREKDAFSAEVQSLRGAQAALAQELCKLREELAKAQTRVRELEVSERRPAEVPAEHGRAVPSRRVRQEPQQADGDEFSRMKEFCREDPA